MKIRARFVAPALLAAAAVPSFVLAQAQTQPSTRPGRSGRASARNYPRSPVPGCKTVALP